MNKYVEEKRYRGKVQALILDWSGTTADAYVVAPAVVFVEVFKRQNVEISMAEARGPMGLRKDLHIKALTEVDEIKERWKNVHSKYPDQSDVDRMFADFVPLQLDCLRKYTTLLPGVAEVTQRLQKKGIKIGSTTGFLRAMVDILEEDAAKQGYKPDASVAGDEVINGARPSPHMVFKNLDMLNITPIHSVIKVDDTVSGVGEAVNAGCWGVGVTRYSNYMDVDTPEDGEKLSDDEIAKRLAKTKDMLEKAGSHYVIDSIADIEPVVEDVNQRLARGERP
ncbi:MAG: phosphonoacetaldehyde hydrolase [Pelagibacteraceae bacterium]|jgi:phosphonoacetaldehyde hydrolase|nr:phosphonoacetaldehyde hydrolase [Pelagibacteraceae bacterium]MBO6468202.1 phosphonoacetaldehyde hydrolase [Pelagibacteraceae bacterium]MBO6469916.1 phosphonoacetaldehyde hydrolase [Pelagibacteraceae bacterium]MDP6783920.1 phosphonoacetaldehyde hydrolase [Alphaproteobacteria bacterium]|tara:strand:- start:72 stop:911 length:840 start_codon:yes stop_codon:yes gene_type:complete